MYICTLPINHLLLENNPEARKLRKDRQNPISEVVVMYNMNGDIVGMLPPSSHYCNEYEFRKPAALLDLLQAARTCGLQETQSGTMKDPPNIFLKIRRQGLSQAHCREIREMCKHGDFGAFSPTYVL